MRTEVAIGVLGAGTVGGTVVDLIARGHLDRLGIDARIVKVYTRRPENKPAYLSHPELFTTDPSDVVARDDVDIVVEALGVESAEQLIVQKEWVLEALRHGKSLVTSNKALLVRHGSAIWQTAREHGCSVRFEACVAGGIPIIRTLSESLCAEVPKAVYGILNGTSNYILSEIAQRGGAYQDVLRSAQELGYAEANPAADVEGRDAEAKLILLAAVTFGVNLASEQIFRKGIAGIRPLDFVYAARKGGATIKPVAMARVVGEALEALVTPMLIPEAHFLARVDGVTNAVLFAGETSSKGKRVATDDWDYAFMGPGAGGSATALAVLGDVAELARKSERPPFYPACDLKPSVGSVRAVQDLQAGFYVRFLVRDQSGIVGEICQVFGREGIHIAEVWQLEHQENELGEFAADGRLSVPPADLLPFVITLEQTTLGQIENALKAIGRKGFVLVEPLCLPIWTVRD